MSVGLRFRYVNHLVEIWIGEPELPESELVARFHKDYLPEMTKQFNESHKWPKTYVYSYHE